MFKAQSKNSKHSKSNNHSPFQKRNDGNAFIQPKLNIGKPGDQFETEADRTADAIVSIKNDQKAGFFSPVPLIQKLPGNFQKQPGEFKAEARAEEDVQAQVVEEDIQAETEAEEEEVQTKTEDEVEIQKKDTETIILPKPETPAITPVVQSQVEEEIQEKEEEEEEPVQTKLLVQKSEDSDTDVEEEPFPVQAKLDGEEVNNTAIESQLNSSKGGGSPLNGNVQTQMESGFNTDFSNVRLHTGSSAVQMNKNLGAQAFTHGSDIYFNEGKYQPESDSGKHLLAHELTHTVQQGATVQTKTVQKVEGDEVEVPTKVTSFEGKVPSEGNPEIQKKCTDCEKEEKLQRKPESKTESNSLVEGQLNNSKNDGNQLPENTGRNVESAPGAENSVYIEEIPSETVIQKTEDCEADVEESGSDSEAEAAETAPDLGNCQITNAPAEEPPEGTEEPGEEATPAQADANPGEPVDQRQGHAPPADESAPSAEEDIQEEAAGEEEGAQQDPCASGESEGGTADGQAGAAANRGTQPQPAQDQAPAPASNEGAEGGASRGGEGNTEVAALANLNQGREGTQEELGEEASPDILSARDESFVSSEEALVALENTSGAVNNIIYKDVGFLPGKTKNGSENDKQTIENRNQANSMASAFLTTNASQVLVFIKNSRAGAEQLRQGTTLKKEALRASIQQYKKSTTAIYLQLRAAARARALNTIQQVEVRHAATLATIENKAATATEQIQEIYTTQSADLEAARVSQLEELNTVYTAARTNLLGLGTRMGEQAVSRAGQHANAYRTAQNEPSGSKRALVLNNEADGFWDGYLTVNRYKARAEAAEEVGEQYSEGFNEEAGKQADQMMCGLPKDIEMTNAMAIQGAERITCTRDNSLDSVETQKQGAIMQAEYAKEQLLNGINTSLSVTISQLRQQEKGQHQLINDYGIRQELAIDKDTEQAIGAVLKGANEGSEKLLEYLEDFRSSVIGREAPAAQDLSNQLEKEEFQVSTSFQSLHSSFEESMAAASTSLDLAQEQALVALDRLYLQGETEGYAMSTTFETTLNGFFTGATNTYQELDINYNQAIDSEVENARNSITAIVTAISSLYQRTSTGLEARFAETAQNMESGFQQSLDNDLDNKVCASAEKAAAEVQPWWKTALKILLIVVVIVVVAFVIGPAVIGAVGAMAGAMAGSLGASAALAGTIGAWAGPIIGGAIVGALAGATIQVGNNLIDMAGGEFSWERLGQGVWGAVLAGAIGGALGGLGGQFAQVILGRFGATALSSGWRFASDFGIQAGFDVVGGVLGDLAAGNPITWQSIVMGLAIGGAVQVSMGGLGGLARRSANIRAGSSDVPSSGSFDNFANRMASGRMGRAAERITDFQGGMMGAGERFGARSGARGDNAPTVDATRQALGNARNRIEQGEALPTRGGDEPEGWRGATDSTEPTTAKTGSNEADTGSSQSDTPGRLPRDVVEDTPGAKFDADNASGGEVTVTREGGIVRCFNPCELIEMRYRDIIDENPNIARDIEMAKQFADTNEGLARAKAQDALDALERLRALEVGQRLNGIVDDINAQNGLTKLAQQDNDFFTSLVSKASPTDLDNFGRFLNENPNLASEITSSPRLMRWIAEEPSRLTIIRDLYNDFIRVRPTGQELSSRDFPEYVGRRGQSIGSDVEPVQGVPRDSLPEPGSEGYQRWQDYLNGRRLEPCFPAGTIVKTPKGNQNIENLLEGDQVYAYDFSKNEPVLAKIEKTFANWTKELISIKTNNQILKSTKNHYFWVDSKSQWIRADNLTENVKLKFLSNNQGSIESISRSKKEVLTYNFKVENYHNYFVGIEGCLVHNDDGEKQSTSKFSDTQAYPSTVYVLRDPNNNKIVIYVGQTIDEAGRFTDHLTNTKSAVYQYLLRTNDTFRQLAETNPDVLRSANIDAFLVVDRPKHLRRLTSYELAVWEQHYIDLHGKAKSQGGTLENKIRAITPESIEFYKLLHNPCE